MCTNKVQTNYCSEIFILVCEDQTRPESDGYTEVKQEESEEDVDNAPPQSKTSDQKQGTDTWNFYALFVCTICIIIFYRIVFIQFLRVFI